jgi:type IV secretion system protein VirB6
MMSVDNDIQKYMTNGEILYIRRFMKAVLYAFSSALFALCFSNVSLANYGASCIELPPITAESYLKTYTPYGELLHYLDISSDCNNRNNSITLCILSQPSTAPCTSVTIPSGKSIRLGDKATNNINLSNDPNLQNIRLYAEKLDSKLCITMPTQYGHVPLMCKTTNTTSTDTMPELNRPECSTTTPVCYDPGYNYSQSPFNFSGRAYQCLSGTLNKVFFKRATCIPKDGIEIMALNPFSSIQTALRQSVFAALLMYTIFYGIRLMLGEEKMSLQPVAMFVLKIVFVTYFAIGTQPIYSTDEKATVESKSGITEYMLPILLQATSDFAQIIFTAAGSSGLCSFDSSKYPNGYGYYGIWDSIDCRIGYYFGIGMKIDSPSVPNATAANIKDRPIDGVPSGNGLLRIFVMLFGFLLGGQILIVIYILVFIIIIMILSIMIQFISSYLVCVITLYIMMYISPVFVPMILFKRTKGYFDSWLRICISCALQPAILAGFIAFMLTIFDTVIYKDCAFQRNTYNISAASDGTNRTMSTFELMVPNDANKCIESPGYKMMQYYSGVGWDAIPLIILKIPFIVDTMYLSSDMIYLVLFCVIFLFFADSMSAFASVITGGPNLNSVTSSIGGIIRKIQSYKEESKDRLGDVKNQLKQQKGGK